MSDEGRKTTKTGPDRLPVTYPESGMYVARAYSVIYLGKLMKAYQNQEPVPTDTVMISFELPTEKAVFFEPNGEQPFAIHKEFTNSIGKKANLNKFLTTWRNKQFDEKEIEEGYILKKVIGKTCQLSVQKKTSKAGNDRLEINAIVPIMKGVEVPPMINDKIYFDIEKLEEEEMQKVFFKLPRWIRTKIRTSQEYITNEYNLPDPEDNLQSGNKETGKAKSVKTEEVEEF